MIALHPVIPSAMRRFQLLPAPPLLPYIDRLWGWEGDGPIALPTLLPGTGAELYFHYRAPFRYHAGAHGVQACTPAHLLCLRNGPLALATAAQVGFIAVRFRAGMLARFTAAPAAQLQDRPLDIADIWGVPGQVCASRVATADSQAGRLALIQDFLLRQMRPSGTDALVERAVSMLYRTRGELTIEQLASRLQLGRRQLERRFQAATGQTPAGLRRLCRFQHTVRALLLTPDAPGLDTALRHGYYDQAHFIHEFRRLAQASPQRYLHQARDLTHFYNPPRTQAGIMQAP